MVTRCLALLVLLLASLPRAARAGEPLPELIVRAPGARIAHSCRVVIPQGTILRSDAAEAALVIAADRITIELDDGSVLRGASDDVPLDQLSGTGIRINGHVGVTLRNLTIAGYRNAIFAARADGLTIDTCRVLSNRSQRLRSTPQAEDYADWLWPHHNEANQWLTSYSAAVYVENTSRASIHDVHVRNSQNGILLDEVSDSLVYDCDCSFLSGWGIGLWKSSRNTIARNALDFCIRGYSHGLYNRGQDSCGLMAFEQSSSNVFAENSVTHCGDAFFCFAGRDALGETWIDSQKAAGLPIDPVPESEQRTRTSAGCNENLLIGNDFSFAAIHGVELTFSSGNRIIGNTFVADGVCGIWGGFSSNTLISGNTFVGNGRAGYSAQRGAINIEHGRDNRISENAFRRNVLGVRLWASDASPHDRLPWWHANADAASGKVLSTRTTVDRNSFTGEPIALSVRSSSAINFSSNICVRVGKETEVEAGAPPETVALAVAAQVVKPAAIPGRTHPVGARDALKGREYIVMTEWGPWEFVGPVVRLHHHEPATATDLYEVFGVEGPIEVRHERWGGGADPEAEQREDVCRVVVARRPEGSPPHVSTDIRVEASDLGAGVWPYALRITGVGLDHHLRGVIVNAEWSLTCFPWTHDPMSDVVGWRADAGLPAAVAVPVRAIDFPLGYRGPSKIGIAPAINAAKIGATRYGLIARATLKLNAGRWAIRTMSDDGIRVIVDGTPVIERWDIHVPTPDMAVLTLDEARAAEVVIEYFQNEGHAELSVVIEPADGER